MTTNNATQGETAPARPAGRQGLIKPLRTLLDTSGLIAIFLLLFVLSLIAAFMSSMMRHSSPLLTHFCTLSSKVLCVFFAQSPELPGSSYTFIIFTDGEPSILR